MTNIEKIQAMSVEELAEFLYEATGCCSVDDCLSCPMHSMGCECETIDDVLEWLLKEVEE